MRSTSGKSSWQEITLTVFCRHSQSMTAQSEKLPKSLHQARKRPKRKAGGNSGNDKIARETKIVGVFYHLSLLMAKERVMAKVEILSPCQNIIINA